MGLVDEQVGPSGVSIPIGIHKIPKDSTDAFRRKNSEKLTCCVDISGAVRPEVLTERLTGFQPIIVEPFQFVTADPLPSKVFFDGRATTTPIGRFPEILRE